MWKASATHALQYQYATVFVRFFTCPVRRATYGFRLPNRSFYLSRAVGQPLVSVPGVCVCACVFVCMHVYVCDGVRVCVYVCAYVHAHSYKKNMTSSQDDF